MLDQDATLLVFTVNSIFNIIKHVHDSRHALYLFFQENTKIPQKSSQALIVYPSTRFSRFRLHSNSLLTQSSHLMFNRASIRDKYH